MLRKLKNKVVELSSHPHAEVYFFFLCFIEAFILPLPTTVMQAPMALSNPHKSMRYIWIASIASVLGGIIGYCLGWLFYSLIENYVMHSSYQHEFILIQSWMMHWGMLVLFPLALCPIPFKITTISAGILGLRFLPFMLMISAARFLHFFFIGFIIRHGQQRFRRWVLKRYEAS